MGDCQTSCKERCGGGNKDEIKVEEQVENILDNIHDDDDHHQISPPRTTKKELPPSSVKHPGGPPSPSSATPPKIEKSNEDLPMEERAEVQLEGGMTYTGQWRGDVRE
eukprot:Selendium_serpulae@DN5790_c1_g1_i3.p1